MRNPESFLKKRQATHFWACLTQSLCALQQVKRHGDRTLGSRALRQADLCLGAGPGQPCAKSL